MLELKIVKIEITQVIVLFEQIGKEEIAGKNTS